MPTMNQPTYELLTQADVMCEVNSYVPGTGLAWPTLFPLRRTNKFDLKSLEGKEGLPISADRVAFNTKAPIKTRKKVGQWSGKLGKMAVSWEKDEFDINEYEDSVAIAKQSGLDSEAKAQLLEDIFNDAQHCDDAMNAKVEIDALRIGSHGVQTFPATIEGDMATEDTIDFNVPTENFGGVSAANQKWSASATADGIKLIAARQSFIAKQGKRKPMFAIMEQAAFDNLCAQSATQKRLFPAAFAAGTLSGDEITLEAINSYMRRKGYPQILVLDSYAAIEHKDGSEDVIKPWAENVVVLSPTIQLGWTYWKPVPKTKNTAAYQADAAFYLMTMYSDVNPKLEVTMAESYYQPVLINRKSLVFINTEETSWNNGEVSA